MKFRIKQCVTGIKGQQPYIAFSVSGNEYDRIKGYHGKNLDGYVADIYKPKRSNDANRYMWQLIGEIADRASVTEYEVYRQAIREAGVFYDWEIDNDKVSAFKENWQTQGIGWFIEQDTKRGEKTLVRAYFGSSAYNSKQMSRLIDYVVDEAKFWDIETMTPAEIARLKGLAE